MQTESQTQGDETMKPHEIENAIGEALSPIALSCWNGMFHDDAVIEAQRNGLQSAIDLIEDLAVEPAEDD